MVVDAKENLFFIFMSLLKKDLTSDGANVSFFPSQTYQLLMFYNDNIFISGAD